MWAGGSRKAEGRRVQKEAGGSDKVERLLYIFTVDIVINVQVIHLVAVVDLLVIHINRNAANLLIFISFGFHFIRIVSVDYVRRVFPLYVFHIINLIAFGDS